MHRTRRYTRSTRRTFNSTQITYRSTQLTLREQDDTPAQRNLRSRNVAHVPRTQRTCPQRSARSPHAERVVALRGLERPRGHSRGAGSARQVERVRSKVESGLTTFDLPPSTTWHNCRCGGILPSLPISDQNVSAILRAIAAYPSRMQLKDGDQSKSLACRDPMNDLSHVPGCDAVHKHDSWVRRSSGMRYRAFCVVTLVAATLVFSGCGGDSPTAPSSPGTLRFTDSGCFCASSSTSPASPVTVYVDGRGKERIAA